MLTKAAFVLKQLYCEIFQFKIDVCNLNIFENVLYSLNRELFFIINVKKQLCIHICVCVFIINVGNSCCLVFLWKPVSVFRIL